MPKSDFIILEEIGKGNSSTVYKCKRKTDNKIYAIKQVKLNQLNSKQRLNALNQIRLLASITNPYILSYKQSFYVQQTSTLYIVTQFANQGDLQMKIQKHNQDKTNFQQMDIWKTAYHLLKALKILHSAKIIHRDIKPNNVYFNNGIAKLGNMSISKILKTTFTITQTGTPSYASPQVWNDEPYGQKSDMWSLGVLLYQMCMLTLPFKGKDLFNKIKLGYYQQLSSKYSICLNQLISKFLQVDENRRLSSQQALKNSIFIYFGKQQKLNPCQQIQIHLLDAILMPKFNINLNQKLPKPKYQMNQIKKSKIYKKLQPVDRETIKKNESSNKIASIHHIISQNKLYPLSSKIISSVCSQKNLNKYEQKLIGSNKILKINKSTLKDSVNDF